MDLDELDLLLEQLAVNSAVAEAAPVNTSSSGHGESAKDMEPPSVLAKSRKHCAANVYSFLPSPVVAAPSPGSAGKEFDLQDGIPPPKPPPLSKKKSLKGEALSGRQENKGSASPAAGSHRKAATSAQKVDPIDDLLGGLSSDLEKIGVRTVAKGNCASCGKRILGKIIQALGEVWHPEHFVCASCNKELGTQGFFEREGQAYCDKDYHRLFSPRCGYCKGPITEKILTALNQSWHPEHFFCTHCGNLFGPQGFLEKDGKPYCTEDFYLLFAPKCSGCSEPVKDGYLNAANGTWHQECFVCADCLQPFTGGSFMELDGRPLCSLHFYSRQGLLCRECNQPISGRCISAMGGKYHPEHFICSFCLHPLSQGRFNEHQGKPYCSSCYTNLIV